MPKNIKEDQEALFQSNEHIFLKKQQRVLRQEQVG